MPLPSYPGEPAQPDPVSGSGQPEPTRPIEPPAPPPPAPPVPPPAPDAYAPPAYQAYYGSPESAGRSWSGTAIASFVCGLTCCLGIPAVILGVIGIIKTSGGKAKGMWMAITGLLLGLLGTLLLVAIALGLSQVDGWDDPTAMSPGECFDSDAAVSSARPTITTVDKTSCTGLHDAEIVAHWSVSTQEEANLLEKADPWESCLDHAATDLVSSLENNADPQLAITLITWDPERITPGDDITCFVYRDGGHLSAPLAGDSLAG